jgi:calcineurin-like phosphoesterase family protein
MQNNIWFFSDSHYGHKNIVRGTTSWENAGDKVRDFDTLEEHNEALIGNLNSCMKENDTAYCLGDWSFGGHENIKNFRERLRCKNIYLIFGNHDQHIEPTNSPYRSLFNGCDYYKEISVKVPSTQSGKFGKTKIIMSHYAMRVWNQSHHGSIMLYGHSHGTLDEMRPEMCNPTWIGDQYFIKNYKTMDVGVDTHNLYPYHLDEILDIMKDREVLLGIDHHTLTTY